MKTALFSLARTLPIVAAIGVSAALVGQPAVAARAVAAHAGGWHGGGWNGGGWHGGGYYRGGYGHWGHYGYWPYWGAVGVGIGIGAIGYYGGYYGGYYRPYYGGYYAPYYDAYNDPQLVVAPTYTTGEAGTARTGQPVPQSSAAAEPIFYPRNGQSAEATESDRRECNRWATTQRGAMGDASIFQRATFACMEGRGYTVR
jgi:hypothetical protein